MPLLNFDEICLIKGLLRHHIINQQQAIAYFSIPERTIHHNVMSDIARGIRYNNDEQYPPASLADCLTFINFGPPLTWPPRWPAELPSADFEFSYSFHPVGQGLFCSGSFSRRNQPDFRWVFDCGTEHGRTNSARGDHVRREIAAFASEQAPDDGERPKLDLVALSHFDEDHLSGMIDLLRTFKVERLLLPYLAPWDRLVIALEGRAALASDLFGFLAAPTEFLLRLPGAEITQIVLVSPTGETPAAEPLSPPEDPIPVEDRRFDQIIEAKVKRHGSEDDNDGLGKDPGLERSNVNSLVEGEAITVGRAWEFVPYNDASLAGLATQAFKTAAKDLARTLKNEISETAKKSALDSLIAIYDAQFKTPKSKKISAERRNKISLFLYSGPIGNVLLTGIEENILRHGMAPIPQIRPYWWLGSDRFGQILTGDGYLRWMNSWNAFKAFFDRYGRLARGSVFQVMHHGSKYNWHKGIAAKIGPLASIFSSDPGGHLGHPHPLVAADFISFNPKQVENFHGWNIRGTYILI